MKANYGENSTDNRMILALISKFVPDKCCKCGAEMLDIDRSEGDPGRAFDDFVRFSDGKFAHLSCYLKEIDAVKSIIEDANEAKIDEKMGSKM